MALHLFQDRLYGVACENFTQIHDSENEDPLDLCCVSKEMLQKSLADVVGFSAAISSCEKGFQWQTALDLFQSLNDAPRCRDGTRPRIPVQQKRGPVGELNHDESSVNNEQTDDTGLIM